MWAINITSSIDLFALILTAVVTFVFTYHYCRLSRRAPDLFFAILLIQLVIQTGVILASDNIVPFGVSAQSVPDGAMKNLWYCRIMWANGMLILATVVLFALRYRESRRLTGWKGAWLYVAAAGMGSFCSTDFFLLPRATPYVEYISWSCLVPWQPLPGRYAWPPVVLWVGTMSYVVYLIVRRPRSRDESSTKKIHSRLVALGVIIWALGGALDTTLAVQDYFGVSPTALLGAIAMLIVGVGLAEEHALAEREREHVTQRFQCYVDPALVKFVIEHPDNNHIEGEARELTVVFTDLEGFTTLTDRLREGAVALLNEYLRLMTPLIRDNKGYRNKFLGDGMMFFYGAPEPNPDHAIHAVSTVLKMQQMMVKLNASIAQRPNILGKDMPELKMRTGVSTGQMIVGDAGPDDACDYTVLGDTVNLGARLESANKTVGTSILLSEPTVKLLPAGLFLVRPIARLQVVGVAQPIMTYEPLALVAEATDAQQQMAELTRMMVEPFQAKEFAACRQAVERFEAVFGPTKLSILYRTHCERYLVESPPSPFTGQIILREK